MTREHRTVPATEPSPFLQGDPKEIIIWSTLGIAGLLFWFVLGFPFHHHNESYVWAVLLEERGFLDATLEKLRSVANHRPLGQAMAWLTYRLSDGSVAPAQVFNIAIALAAWIAPLIAVRQHRFVGVAALVSGGMLFPGYIYAFHLHGVFYSPVLFLCAMLALAALRPPTPAGIAGLTAGTIVAALFHPYALLVYLAYACGIGFERRTTLSRKVWITLGISVAVIAGLIFALVILPGNAISATPADRIAGFHSSYRSTELHPLMSLGVALLILLTVAGTQARKSVRAWFAGVTVLALVTSIWIGLPMIYLWVVTTAVRMALQGRFALTALVSVAAVLPAIAPTGSPTYATYVLLLCTLALTVHWSRPEEWLKRIPTAAVAVFVCATLGVAVLLRMGVHVPLLGGITAPIVAEREKTLQLETILAWWESSAYQSTRLELGQKAPNPVDVQDASDRRFRPPTSQVHLQTYMKHRMLRRHITPSENGRLIVLFGGAESPEGTKVFGLPGGAAGPASVYLIQ